MIIFRRVWCSKSGVTDNDEKSFFQLYNHLIKQFILVLISLFKINTRLKQMNISFHNARFFLH